MDICENMCRHREIREFGRPRKLSDANLQGEQNINGFFKKFQD